jgi:hypothetical protein
LTASLLKERRESSGSVEPVLYTQVGGPQLSAEQQLTRGAFIVLPSGESVSASTFRP